MNLPSKQFSHPDTNQALSKKRLAFADGLRGLAALWVVLFHLSEGKHIESIKAATPDLLYSIIFTHGDFGVAVFFVLSGFVMALTVKSIHINLLSAFKFTARRFIRLAPPYYFAIFFALFFIYIKAVFLGGEKLPFGFTDVALHLLFLQELFAVPHINTVFWTLCVELQFYIVFAILFLIADYIAKTGEYSHVRQKLVALMAIIALLWPLGVTSETFWPGSFIQHWYSFLAGVLSYWASQDAGKVRTFTLTYLALIVLISIVISSGFVFIVAMTSALIIYAGAQDKMSDWLTLSWIQFIGLISYSLYLLHNPLTGAISWVVHRLIMPGFIADFFTVLFAIAVSILISWLVFLIIERPSIKWSHMIPMRK
ncbi:MAG: acyltransferase family protein [Methylotenera sp.]